MLGIATTLYGLLDRRERLQFRFLVLGALMMAALETFAIAAVVPFLALAADPAQIEANRWISAAHAFSGIEAPRGFLIALGLALFAAILVSNSWTAFMLWAQGRFTQACAHGCATRLMRWYAAQPYVYFLRRNSAELTKNALHEIDLVIDQTLMALLRLVTRSVVSVSVAGLLIAFDPALALVVALVLGVSYGGAIRLLRRRMSQLGQGRAAANARRFRLAGELLGAIKDVKLAGRESIFLDQFEETSARFTRAKALFQFLSELPRYLLEVVAFGGVVLIAVYYLARGESSQQLFPVLGLYAFAGYRLMPSLQQIFNAAMALNFAGASVQTIARELAVGDVPAPPPVAGGTRMRLTHELELDEVEFAYPEAGRSSLHGVSLTLRAAETLGVVGTTGSGKSTLVDLMLGLLRPVGGEIRVDGVRLDATNLRAWQNNLGYVPQQIYLADDSIARNIAFGRLDSEIDMDRVERAARIAQIHDFIARQLPDGYATVVGERGVRLSGGQRQRIGIARALYDDPEVVVFDEATSALDPATEAAVMEAIRPLAHQKTLVIISHRRETLDWADRIVELDAGRVRAVTGAPREARG